MNPEPTALVPLILLLDGELVEASLSVSLLVEALLLFFLDLLLELEPVVLDWSLSAVDAVLDFCPERVSAGVLVAFSCARPELLMCDCALSRPVDLDVELVSLEELGLEEDDVLGLEELEELSFEELGLIEDDEELGLDVDALPFIEELPFSEPLVPALTVPLVSDEDDAAPLYFDDELVDGDWVEEVLVPLVLGAFLFLCMSPSARADPLASTMMEEKKTGASLRMWSLLKDWLVDACRKSRCKRHATRRAPARRVNSSGARTFYGTRQKNADARMRRHRFQSLLSSAGTGLAPRCRGDSPSRFRPPPSLRGDRHTPGDDAANGRAPSDNGHGAIPRRRAPTRGRRAARERPRTARAAERR